MLRNAAAEYYGADLEDISLASLILDSCSPSAADGGVVLLLKAVKQEYNTRGRGAITIPNRSRLQELWRRLVSDGLDVRLGQVVQSITRTDSKNICVTTNAQL